MKLSRRMVVVLIVLGGMAGAALWFVHFTGLLRFWTTDQAALARQGQPIVQAIYAFHEEQGTWPDSLQALVPQYLPTRPAGLWFYSTGCLGRITGIPHTAVCFDFAQPADGWQSRGDYGLGRLNVPAFPTTQPFDPPVYVRDQ